MTRNVKIVATVGPASQSEDTLEQLIQAGMNVARMKFLARHARTTFDAH